MLVVHRFITEREACPYLPDESSQLEYEVVLQLSPEEYEERMNAGWRKFGAYMYRPVCRNCGECRPVRILVDEFTPDRSQRRCLQANADLAVRFSHPVPVDEQRVDLYNRYHAAQNVHRGWDEKNKTLREYAEAFLINPLRTAHEVSVWEGDRLLAVALTDITPNIVSGVYHYHDPDESHRKRGLGTFVMLQAIEMARQMGKSYAHFGYFVADCGSLNYKTRFRPCELRNDDGEWIPVVKPV